MISEGPCDTEDEFYSIFDQIKAVLVSIRDFFQKRKKILQIPNFGIVVYVRINI